MVPSFNPYISNMQPKTPQQLQMEINSILQNQYAPMYNAYQQQGINMGMQPQNPNQPSTNGMYVFVNDYNEVENYPVPADGRAVLLYITGQNVYYSKKIVNGQPMLQAFNYMPINMNGSVDSVGNQPADDSPNSETFENKVLTALQELSNRITTLETAKLKQQKSAKKEIAVEANIDEL